MNLLLDTHVALWAITDSPRLSTKARDLIESPKATIWISAASLWEIAIKHSLDRGELPGHHQDPFDRMLVAQALTEPMRLLTHDPMMALYSDTVVRV